MKHTVHLSCQKRDYRAPECFSEGTLAENLFLASNFASGREDIDDLSGNLDWDDLSF